MQLSKLSGRSAKISAMALAAVLMGATAYTVPGGRHTVSLKADVDAEIIDLRTLVPLDLEAIEASVKKTGRCVIVHEATRTCGFGAELMSVVNEGCFYHLEAQPIRVTGWDTPYPHAQEWDYFPGPARVGAALLKVMED